MSNKIKRVIEGLTGEEEEKKEINENKDIEWFLNDLERAINKLDNADKTWGELKDKEFETHQEINDAFKKAQYELNIKANYADCVLLLKIFKSNIEKSVGLN